MALPNFLKLLKLELTSPFQNPSILPKPNYTTNYFQTITPKTKIIRSLTSHSLTPPPPPPPLMERENTQRRFAMAAMMMLLSVTLAASPASASSEAEFVKKTISSHNIVIFSKSYCPYCRRAKDVFKELNQSPHVIELDERDDGYDIQDALGGIVGRRTVPQVFINGKHIGGSDDTVEAYQNGELAKLLGIDSTDHDDL